MSPNDTLSSIHPFWFGEEIADADVANDKMKLWFGKNDAMDAEIAQRYQPLLESLRDDFETLADPWIQEAQSLLNLVVLLDQFARNIYRGTPDSFFFDPFGRRVHQHAMDHELHLQLRPIERVFLYLPLEHAEDIEDQNRSVELYKELELTVPENQRAPFTGFTDYARKHLVVIERFGRFPHRNKILGRASTEEEQDFLAQPGSSF
jgi:uncharacterized protein (DUF924 family)